MSSNPFKVLIVDDDLSRSRDWAKKIESLRFEGLTVESLDMKAVVALMKAPSDRRTIARRNSDPFASDILCDLDTFDVLIVDYDLQELLGKEIWSTGLQVTTLARAFSRVKLIVLVNQFGTNSFDLTLVKNVKSYSDFDVGSDQLMNRAFWDRSLVDGFAPWAWSDGVLRASRRIDTAIKWITPLLDKPVLNTLGFSTELDTGAAQETCISKELWQECLNAPDQSFRQLVKESEFLTQTDREEIAKFDESCARVAATLILHWLDRWVIPANEVLIDLPHLATSYPWLLNKKEDVDCWQSTTSLDKGFDAFHSNVLRHEFVPGLPLSRPVVWRQKIVTDEELMEPAGFTYDGFPDLVFCEDTSQFHDFADSRPFPCRLPGADTQRFVADPAKIKPKNAGHPLDGVLYEPSVLFAL